MKLDIVTTETITLGDRYREDMGDLDGLVKSIIDKGLINPITVQTQTDNDKLLLVAGGRRFTACCLAGMEEVPVRIYDKPLTKLELRGIELEENIQRKDLEWIEEVNLKREIHELQIAIHGKKTSTLPDADGWAMRDTAKLLGKSVGGISTDLKLANAVDQLPDLDWGECSTKRDAMKLLNRVEETAIKAELSRRAQTIDEKASNGNTLKARQKRLIDGYIVKDFHEAAENLQPKMFNFCEIDPPYAIKLAHMKRKDGVSKYNFGKNGYNEIDQEGYVQFMHTTLKHCYRLMADNSWLVLWFAPEPWFQTMYEMLLDVGFMTTRMVGIWTKPSGQSMNPSTRLANAYEPFFWARKGDPALAKPGTINVFPFTQTASQKKIHPTERPLELMKAVLSTFAFTNAKVLVPFAGSGITMMAANQLQMQSVGFDLSQEFKDSFTVRVMQSQEI